MNIMYQNMLKDLSNSTCERLNLTRRKGLIYKVNTESIFNHDKFIRVFQFKDMVLLKIKFISDIVPVWGFIVMSFCVLKLINLILINFNPLSENTFKRHPVKQGKVTLTLTLQRTYKLQGKHKYGFSFSSLKWKVKDYMLDNKWNETITPTIDSLIKWPQTTVYGKVLRLHWSLHITGTYKNNLLLKYVCQ